MLLVFFVVVDFNLFFIIAGLILLLVIILYLPIDRYENYITSNMESAGLYLRVAYLIVPVLYLLFSYATWKKENRLTKRIYLACISSPLVMLMLALISSTIADRVSYYFIILVTFVILRISLRNKNNSATMYLIMTFLISISSLSVWVVKSRYIPNYIYHGYIAEWLS
jgi:hypothetical protein